MAAPLVRAAPLVDQEEISEAVAVHLGQTPGAEQAGCLAAAAAGPIITEVLVDTAAAVVRQKAWVAQPSASSITECRQ